MIETILSLPQLPGGAVRLVGWVAQAGRNLQRGEPLCLIEQAGRVRDLPALRDGVLCRTLAIPGQTLTGGALLAVLGTPATASTEAWSGDVVVSHGSLHVDRWATSAAAPRGICLLLHGFAGSLETWGGTAAALGADGFVAVAPDLPCHGRTRADAPSVQAIATLLESAWNEVIGSGALGAALPAHLVGHSMGGAVAVLLAAARPDRIASLTLIAPIGFARVLNKEFMAGVLDARDRAGLGAALRPLTARTMPQDDAALDVMLTMLSQHRLALQELLAGMSNGERQLFDLAPVLAEIDVPIRLIFGNADAVLPWDGFVPAPHIPVHRLSCGHMPHWEQPGIMRHLLAQRDWQPRIEAVRS